MPSPVSAPVADAPATDPQAAPAPVPPVPHSAPMTPAGLAGADSAAFGAWFAGSRIVADGAPLICYHGTTADFTVFMAHAPVTVYRLDGVPIDRVDSWDVDGDWRRRPEAFHYGALTDAVQLGAEAALAMREREAQAMAAYRRARGDATPAAGDPTDDPADDTLRRLTDLRRLVGRALVQTTEVRPSGDGHYFTPDPGYSFIRDIGRHDAGRVMPVYLAIRNPVYLNAAQIESAGSAHWVAHYRALGHDGAIFSDHADLRRRGWNGATQIVAFDAHQIKSVFNVGTYDPANPDIRFRRDSDQPLQTPAAPALATPTPAALHAFTLPPGLGSPALARHGLSATQRAAAFAAWFKASHVRHADGTPRICYHGTTGDFSVFRPHRGTDADPGWYGSGIYLTADPATASAYAGELAGADGAPDTPAPRVIAAYVSLQRPYVWPPGRAAATTPEAARALRAELEAAGYDGVVVPNPYAEPELAAHWEVVAFDPAQIKSAYNVGTFDPANDDIRYARSTDRLPPQAGRDTAAALDALADAGTLRTQTAAFRAWFGASRVVKEGAPQVVYHGTSADLVRFDLARAGEHSEATGAVAFFTSSPRVASGYAVHLDRNAEMVALLDEARALRERWAAAGATHGPDSAAYRAAEAAYWAVAQRRDALSAAIHDFAAPTTGASVLAAYLALANPLELDAGGQQARKDGLMAKAIAQAQHEGRDGVIVRNVLDYATPATREVADVFVVFDAAAVKAVYGNSGAYARASDDLRFARTAGKTLDARQEGAFRDAGKPWLRSEAFQRWFAGSKVAERDGAPRVMYHGTDTTISQFYGRSTAGWFSENPSFASDYAHEARSGIDEEESAPNVLPVYLAVRNPLQLSFDMNDEAKKAMRAVKALGIEADFPRLNGAFKAWEIVNNPRFLAGVKRAGYDGIRVKERGHWTWAILEPHQAKSAIGNLGTYDAANPDIRFARSAATTLPRMDEKEGLLRGASPAFAAWFSGSKIVDASGAPLVVYHGTPFDNGGVFAASHIGTASGVDQRGFFFTSSAVEANHYAQTIQGFRYRMVARGGTPHVVPAYVRIERPVTFADLQPDPRFAADDESWLPSDYYDNNREHVLAMLDAKRGDGVMLEHAGHTLVIAMKAEQIKSVYNIGTFDPANPDIRFARDRTRALPTLPHKASFRGGTPAFAAWSSGSKIVDATGAPLVLYHGTKSDFTAYDIKSFGATDEGLLGKGFYFTYNPEEASSYALNEQYGKGDAPNVQPVYVSLKHPFVISQGRLPDGRTVQDLHKGTGVTASGGRAVRQLAEEGGHDGIVWASRDGRILHVVAWRPEQIKSAIGNTGTYDPEHADIRFARSAAMRLPREQQHVAFNQNVAGNHNVANLADKQNMASLPRRRAEPDCYEP